MIKMVIGTEQVAMQLKLWGWLGHLFQEFLMVSENLLLGIVSILLRG